MSVKKTIIAIFILLSLTVFAQKNKNIAQKKVGFEITLKTLNLKNNKLELYLISGVNKKPFVTDSVFISENSQTVKLFQPKKIINAIYYLRFKNQKKAIGLAIDNGALVDLYLDNENIEQIKSTNNSINKDFIEYQLQENDLTVEQKINSRKTLLNRYPNSILNLYFSAENKITEKTPSGIDEKISYRNTFFAFTDLTDKRFLFLPNLTKLLYKYVTLLPITNENYIENIDLTLKGMDCKNKNYGLFSNYYIANLTFFESNQLETAYNYLFKNYIDKNLCDIFLTADYNSYSNKYFTNLKVPKGSKTPDFELISKDTITYKLSEIYPKNDFTFVAFYSPFCIHCQEKMPQVNESFKNLKSKYPSKSIQLIGVLNDLDESGWKQFIEDKNLKDWLNLKPIDSKRKYQEDFNAYSNPSFFLINKNGEVLLKTFNSKAIEVLINN